MLVEEGYGCRYFYGRTAMSTRQVARRVDLRDSLLLRDNLSVDFRVQKRRGSEGDSEELYSTEEDEVWQDAEDRIEFANYADDNKTRTRNPFKGFERYLKLGVGNSFLTFEHPVQNALLPQQVEYCLGLLKRNMEELYAVAGWPLELGKKKTEIEDPTARLLFIRENNLMPWYAGFVHFRFVREDSAAVLYVYELQLDARLRRKGIGKHVMKLLEGVAEEFEMDWMMLTVFKKNEAALGFYKKLGYKVDETSPKPDSEASYLILSKEVN